MNNIQQRLVAAFKHHRFLNRENVDYGLCDCGEPITYEHVAEIIVIELGLTEETSAAFDFGETVRYVTAWEPTE